MKVLLFILPLSVLALFGCGKKPGDENKKKTTSAVVGEAPKANGETLSLSIEIEAKYDANSQSFLIEKEHSDADRSVNGLDCLATISKGTYQITIESGRMRLSLDRNHPQMNLWISTDGKPEFQPWGNWQTSIRTQNMQTTALIEIEEGDENHEAKLTYTLICQN